MDPDRNPFEPGAGTRPPELVGRSELLDEATVALRRLSRGKAERSVIFVGLRGVGKTVLLNDLQEWGYHTWNAAVESPITEEDVERGSVRALRRLDEGFFRVRFDRLTKSEKRYLVAMAHLGPGPHRSGEIAEVYGAKATKVGPVRDKLIHKGMIYAPAHGETAFTVPLFDAYLKRVAPSLQE